jgi:hypothetical protein
VYPLTIRELSLDRIDGSAYFAGLIATPRGEPLGAKDIKKHKILGNWDDGSSKTQTFKLANRQTPFAP